MPRIALALTTGFLVATAAGCGAGASAPAATTAADRGVVLVYRPHGAAATVPAGALDAIGTALRRRLAGLGVKSGKVAREGEDRVAVTLPDRATADRVKGTLGVVGLLRFYDWEADVLGRDGRPHPTDVAVTGGQAAGQPGAATTTPAEARRIADRAGRDTVVLHAESDPTDPRDVRRARNAVFVLADAPVLTGDDLTHVRVVMDSATGQPAVVFSFTAAGRARFHAVTRRIARRGQAEAVPGVPPVAVANHFAIALDDHLISVPYVDPGQNPDGISGANGSQISGAFTRASAQRLAAILAAGPLPGPLDLVQERGR